MIFSVSSSSSSGTCHCSLLTSDASCGSDSRSIAATAADSGRLFSAAGHSWVSVVHPVVDPQRQRIDGVGAADHRRFRRRALDDAGTGADHGDGLPHFIVQLARHLAPGLLLRRHQRPRQLTVLRQPQPQLLIQLALALNAGPNSNPVRLWASSDSSRSRCDSGCGGSLTISATPLSSVANSAPCQP